MAAGKAVYRVRTRLGDMKDFVVDTRYKIERLIGEGATGLVALAIDTLDEGRPVAVKKMHSLFLHEIDAKRGLRELRILRSLNHENILGVRDIMTIPPHDIDAMDAVYLVMELMETDLHRVIYSDQVLTDLHLKYFMYQMAKALYYIHSADVVHRDLKPANCLLLSDSTLKIADFGLSKSDINSGLSPAMTAYVVTRWYRAPEIILDRTRYGAAVDMWAAGCIFAEMLNREPLFPGSDEHDEIRRILSALGMPTAEQIARVQNPVARTYLQNVVLPAPGPFPALFPPDTNPDALDLLYRLLDFDPETRLSAAGMLDHPYFADIREPSTELIAPQHVFMGVDYYSVQLTTPVIRQLIYNEMLFFHPEMGQFADSLIDDLGLPGAAEESLDVAWMDTSM
eukprot:c18247_g1_i2.p1 GENE.c18247_g1_i2~~c18247_g1_i2.p1  ORF type:complete len:426 (+),score=86.55 c18247_g1_i2:88-1278(+)